MESKQKKDIAKQNTTMSAVVLQDKWNKFVSIIEGGRDLEVNVWLKSFKAPDKQAFLLKV